MNNSEQISSSGKDNQGHQAVRVAEPGHEGARQLAGVHVRTSQSSGKFSEFQLFKDKEGELENH